MIAFEYLSKANFPSISRGIFGILAENMADVSEKAWTYESWYQAVGGGLQSKQRQIVLIRDSCKIVGFFQYYTNSTTFMMEEIQLMPEYRGTGIFRALYGFLLANIGADLDFVEAYAHRNNHKSIAILKKLGLSVVGTAENGNLYHFKGSYADLKAWYTKEKRI